MKEWRKISVPGRGAITDTYGSVYSKSTKKGTDLFLESFFGDLKIILSPFLPFSSFSLLFSPGDINQWGHSEGTIGNTIDYCVQIGIFTKKQIMILAGTNMNKINAHLRSMAKKDEYVAVVKHDGIVSFKN